MSNGKGDSPRNCFSKAFKDNYDSINWGRAKTIDEYCGSPRGTFKKFIKEQSELEKFTHRRNCLYCEGTGMKPNRFWIAGPDRKCAECKGTGKLQP